ncbi:hypothetical protein Avbf_18754, partial [Armadillidium vulgare]
LFERAGNKSFDQNYFNNVGKGGDDLKNVILRNGTPVDLTGYKFKDPDGKKKEEERDVGYEETDEANWRLRRSWR